MKAREPKQYEEPDRQVQVNSSSHRRPLQVLILAEIPWTHWTVPSSVHGVARGSGSTAKSGMQRRSGLARGTTSPRMVSRKLPHRGGEQRQRDLLSVWRPFGQGSVFTQQTKEAATQT